ncbi:MAG: IS1595 family transposase [Holosporales bacterium]
MKAHGIYECRDCGYQGSVTRGTLFQDTHKPLRLWFQAIWYVVHQQNGMSALGLQRTLGLGSYHTAWEWLHKLRRAMVRPNRDKLAGIVEVDETFIGGERPGKRGRGAEGKVFVFIAVEDTEKGIGRIRLSTLEDASSESLSAATLRAVNVGSTVHSDGWEAYNALSMHGYTHVPIMHKNAKSRDATPLAHMVAYFTLPGVAHALCGAHLLK